MAHSFYPLPHDLSLEDLVPDDHFYHPLEARLDLYLAPFTETSR
jgi:hypothetical protein